MRLAQFGLVILEIWERGRVRILIMVIYVKIHGNYLLKKKTNMWKEAFLEVCGRGKIRILIMPVYVEIYGNYFLGKKKTNMWKRVFV